MSNTVLKKILKSWFDEIFFFWWQSILHFSTLMWQCVKFRNIPPTIFSQKFRQSNFFTKKLYTVLSLISRKFLKWRKIFKLPYCVIVDFGFCHTMSKHDYDLFLGKENIISLFLLWPIKIYVTLKQTGSNSETLLSTRTFVFSSYTVECWSLLVMKHQKSEKCVN